MTTEWFHEFGAPEGGQPKTPTLTLARITAEAARLDTLDAQLVRISTALAKEHGSNTSIGKFFAVLAERFTNG